MNELMPWLALSGLGLFHGINPAMGWLFAVALGLHRQSRRIVLLALVPIALGHAVSIGVVAAVVVLADTAIPGDPVRYAAGVALIGWAGYHRWRGRRHRVRVGLRTGLLGLAGWSFLMATAHGAGLMLTPALLPLTQRAADAGALDPGTSLNIALAAVAVHTVAMIATTAVVAVIVHEWLGVAFLRRGWINLDLLWTLALVVTGAVLLVM